MSEVSGQRSDVSGQRSAIRCSPRRIRPLADLIRLLISTSDATSDVRPASSHQKKLVPASVSCKKNKQSLIQMKNPPAVGSAFGKRFIKTSAFFFAPAFLGMAFWLVTSATGVAGPNNLYGLSQAYSDTRPGVQQSGIPAAHRSWRPSPRLQCHHDQRKKYGRSRQGRRWAVASNRRAFDQGTR